MEELPDKKYSNVGFRRQKSKSEDVLSKPSKSKIEALDQEVHHDKREEYFKNVRANAGPITLLIVLCMVAPSWDVYSDWAVTIQLFVNGDPLYAMAMMVPQISNIVFTFFIWRKLEKNRSKRWSWTLVITQCWPQVFAARIVWMIISGNPRWREQKKALDSKIGTLEPYTESLPSVLILTAVWITESKIRDNLDFQGGDQKSIPYVIFMSAYISSILISSFGMIKFFKNGPVEFLPSDGKLDGYLSWKSLAVFFSVLFMVVSKGGLLALMIRDRPMLKYFYSARVYAQNVGRNCPQITVLYHDYNFRQDVFNLTGSSKTQDVFTKNDNVEDILTWDKSREYWFHKTQAHLNETRLPAFRTPVCGDWEKHSLGGPDFILWFIFNCSPQIIQAMLVLCIKFGLQKSLSTLLNYPQTVMSPGFSPYGFTKNKDGKLALSRGVTWVTCLLTFLGYLASFLVIWDTVQDYPNSRKDHRLLIQYIFILFLLSCLLTALVLHLPFLQNKTLEMSGNTEVTSAEETSMVQIKGRPRLRSMSV